jgi:flagellin
MEEEEQSRRKNIMAMVVQHNMQAMNSSRMLGTTSSQQAKSTEKLSSGYKINRAADDAAGLTISEKMRKQMRGLARASTNAQDGVSAVQTAEGALTEVHSMLQRMNELAVQSANGTNSKSDRDAIQAEVNQLTTEIDRVAETTKFNETYLLKGDATSTTQKNVTFSFKDAGIDSKFLTIKDNFKADGTTADKSRTQVTVKSSALTSGSTVTIGGKTYTIASVTAADSAKSYYVAAADMGADGISTKDDSLISGDKAAALIQAELIKANSVGSVTDSVVSTAATVTASGALAADVVFDITKGNNTTAKDLSFNLHVGADSDMTNKIGVNIETMDTKNLGINGIDVSDDNGMKATYAIDSIADAVQKVSSQRSALGAVQNRLEHTIANLDNIVENTTSAESRIRDTDMADEMVNYSKNNILAQAGQSMLAQANQSTQGVLSLLK